LDRPIAWSSRARNWSAAAGLGGLGGGAFLLGALALAGGRLAAGDLLRKLLVLAAQLLQATGTIDARLLLRGADQAATDGPAPGLGAQAVTAVVLRLEAGDLRAQRLGLTATVGLLLAG